MSHPYENLPDVSYWRTGVSVLNPLEISELWQPKHKLGEDDAVMTFGSCFAQHISRALVANNFHWINAEEGPAEASDRLKARYNYGVFSARTGNIYTAKSLRQWLEWALGRSAVPSEYWEKDGRIYDPFRPAIEPNGFASVDEMFGSRQVTLDALVEGIKKTSLFVFTLGLTEAWENQESGYTYATCPGTNAGTFDADAHKFVNYSYPEVHADLTAAIDMLRSIRPGIKILLTVSPVPLTATAEKHHIVAATTYSKSVLRAVAGEFSSANDDVDYFPSYEIITAPCFRGMFFNPNMRTVAARGVAFVMEHFMAHQSPPLRDTDARLDADAEVSGTGDDLVCEEAILEAFSNKEKGARS